MSQTEDKTSRASGPPQMLSFHHVSIPCRDLDEGIKFYIEVLGGKLRLREPKFASIRIAGADIGIGSDGCSYIQRGAEYPHFAFHVGGEEIVQMKEWLGRCGVPTTSLWTRGGVEALLFFRDPSGNLVELYCEKGCKGASEMPKGPARGHGVTIDVDKLYYDKWQVPASN